MLTKKPRSWREGQTIWNFLEYLSVKGYAPPAERPIADTFHIPDEELDKLYEEFLNNPN
jgi:hypothetical protein